MNRSVGLVQFCYKWVMESKIVSLSRSILISPGVTPMGNRGACDTRGMNLCRSYMRQSEAETAKYCPIQRKCQTFHPKIGHQVLKAFQRR